MSATDLTELGVAAAAAAIREGHLTSEALVRACLDRIAVRDGEVHAFVHLDPEHALRQARQADEARMTGQGGGPLHGVPIAIKDVIDTADLPTESGCRALAGRRPAADATVVQRLRAAGAVILGKTVTTELATLTPGPTRNPVNLGHTPGGSSSGSAAAVSDRMAPAALGTQTMGSVIRPAAFCGVFGFKPSFGLIPRTGVLPQASSFDTVGVMARSIADLALVADVLQGPDGADPTARTDSRARLADVAGMAWPLPPSFAFVKTPAWEAADPRQKEAFGELVEALGAQCVEMDLTTTVGDGLDAARVIHRVEIADALGSLLDSAPGLLSANVTEMIEEGRTLKATAYLKALALREHHRRIVAEIFINHGSILTPAAPGPAPATLARTGDPVFNIFWTYLGTPAVTLPLLEADGLPIGVQLVGAPGDDGRLLRSARLLVEQLANG